MKILTVSACPYLLTRLGKINSDILSCFCENYDVFSAAWHVDTTWYMPSEEGKFFFENDKPVCEIYPFINTPEQASSQLYEIMKKTQPDVVITIGDYHETLSIAPIKSMYPQLFTWIGIFTVDALPINENYRETLENVDYIFATIKEAASEISNIIGDDCEYLPYGANEMFQRQSSAPVDSFRAISVEKNSQQANIGCFLKGIKAANQRENKIKGYLHSNIYDVGEYDIHLLMNRLQLDGIVDLPSRFVGLNDGYTLEEMRNEYVQSDIVVDTSVRSATGLSLLEGMSTGCIPIVSDVGALADIVSCMPKRYQYILPCHEFLGDKEERFAIASWEGLADKVVELYEVKQKHPDEFNEIKQYAKDISTRRYSRKRFINRIEEVIKEIHSNKSKITVETIV
jgi:glycosyltransferase involved in cell wall biosynthesis